MSRVYTCTFAPTASTTAVDLFEFTPADDKPIRLLALDIAQTTELGDAQEEQLEWSVRRGVANGGGTGGTTATNGVGTDASGATSGFTFEAMNTTVTTFSSVSVMHRSAFNVRTGLPLFWTPETTIEVAQGSVICVRIEAAPTDSVTFVGTAYILENG